jgi:hypothetical protein
MGMAGVEDAQTLFGFGVGSAAGPTTPVGVYATGGNQYRISGISTGINGNYNVTTLNNGVLTISGTQPITNPPVTSDIIDGLTNSLFAAMRLGLTELSAPWDCVAETAASGGAAGKGIAAAMPWACSPAGGELTEIKPPNPAND